MRLIDADALKQTFCAECNHSIKCEDCDIDYHFEYLAPTVDAVEVVRCENCRWFGEEDEDGQCWCHFNDISALKHSFCSHGERRKDEAD